MPAGIRRQLLFAVLVSILFLLVDGGHRFEDRGVHRPKLLEHGGAQCGICTPGMLIAAEAFIAGGGEPTDEAIREAIRAVVTSDLFLSK